MTFKIGIIDLHNIGIAMFQTTNQIIDVIISILAIDVIHNLNHNKWSKLMVNDLILWVGWWTTSMGGLLM